MVFIKVLELMNQHCLFNANSTNDCNLRRETATVLNYNDRILWLTS